MKLKNGKNVFEPVQYVGQQIVSSRWVTTEKINNGKKVVKLDQQPEDLMKIVLIY